MAFSNNLQQNDRVLDTVSGRQGKVARTPRSPEQRRTSIVFDGNSAAQYLDVMQLRLIVNGKTPEEGPPVDGTPPEDEKPVPTAAANGHVLTAALDALKKERAHNVEDMDELDKRFRALRDANEKLDKAIALLTAE